MRPASRNGNASVRINSRWRAAQRPFIPWEIYGVLCLEAKLRQVERGDVVRVPIAHQPVFPAALLAKGGETVRVSAGPALGIRDRVHLAMRLLEGLSDAVIFEPAAPMQNGRHIG